MAIKRRHVKAVIQLRRATEKEWIEVNPILRVGEPALSTDVYKLKIGDGKRHWYAIPYLNGNGSGGDSAVQFITTTEGLVGETDCLYINKVDQTALIWNGEEFEELESTSIDDLKNRMTQAELDIDELEKQIPQSGDKNYVHKQSVASSEWTIVHNLGKYPSITVVDSAGTVVVGEIVLQTTEQAVISFNGAFSGKAYCN